MTTKLTWFTVHLALSGVDEEDATEAVKDLQDELNTRSHLRNAQIFWEESKNRVIAQVDLESLHSKTAGEGMSEELLEIAVAVLREYEHIHIEVLDVRPNI